MMGLLQQEQPQRGPGLAQQPARPTLPPQQGIPSQQGQMSEDALQRDKEQIVDKGTILLHSPETRDQVMQMISSGDPVDGVAKASVMTIQRLDEVARKAGKETSDTAKLAASIELMEQIIEIGETAKVFKFSDEQRKYAMALGIQNYMKAEIQAGRIDPQELAKGMNSEIEALPEDQKGKIDTEMKGMNKLATSRGNQNEF